jgi:hypothetical protein
MGDYLEDLHLDLPEGDPCFEILREGKRTYFDRDIDPCRTKVGAAKNERHRRLLDTFGVSNWKDEEEAKHKVVNWARRKYAQTCNCEQGGAAGHTCQAKQDTNEMSVLLRNTCMHQATPYAAACQEAWAILAGLVVFNACILPVGYEDNPLPSIGNGDRCGYLFDIRWSKYCITDQQIAEVRNALLTKYTTVEWSGKTETWTDQDINLLTPAQANQIYKAIKWGEIPEEERNLVTWKADGSRPFKVKERGTEGAPDLGADYSQPVSCKPRKKPRIGWSTEASVTSYIETALRCGTKGAHGSSIRRGDPGAPFGPYNPGVMSKIGSSITSLFKTEPSPTPKRAPIPPDPSKPTGILERVRSVFVPTPHKEPEFYRIRDERARETLQRGVSAMSSAREAVSGMRIRYDLVSPARQDDPYAAQRRADAAAAADARAAAQQEKNTIMIAGVTVVGVLFLMGIMFFKK